MHPDLLTIFGFTFGTYGICLAAGLLCASAVALRRAKRDGIPPQDVMDLIFYGVIAGIVGSRLAYVVKDLLTDQYLLQHPSEMIFSRTNFVFLGGVLLGLPVCAFLSRRRGLGFWRVGDVLAAALPLGHAFGRVGCFMAGCCYGAPLPPDSPFHYLAVHFPESAPAGSGPVWPVQLMESAGNLAIFLLLLALWRRRRFNGQIALFYILSYGALRFSLEFLRGDYVERGHFGALSTSQAIILAGVICVPFLWRHLRRTQPIAQKTEAEEASPEGAGPSNGAQGGPTQPNNGPPGKRRVHKRGNRMWNR